MKFPAKQHPVNTYSAKPQVINHFLSLSTPQQDTCVIYVHNRTNKDVDYLGYKWASVTVTHCFIATCCSLAEGWRQICLSQKREQLKKKKKGKQTKNQNQQTLVFLNH